MAHKDQDIHFSILLRIIEENQPITLLKIYDIIVGDKELMDNLDFTRLQQGNTKVLRHESKTRTQSLLGKLIKEERIIKKKEGEDEIITYHISESGKDSSTSVATINNKKKNEKTDKGEDKKGNNWMSWSQPIFVPDNNRWEFYKKNQEEEVLEIYHSESEEEIKQQHKSKVMSHIMAAMKESNVEGEKKEGGLKNQKETPRSPDGIKKKDTSVYIHNELMYEMMRMKLEGIPYFTIVSTIKERYNLSLMSIGLYFSQVLKDIRERARETINETIQEHLQRYEELYKWFRENGYDKAALKALERKERLLGLHDGEKVEGAILNALGEKGLGKQLYNWKQLSESERSRVIQLARKTIIILTPTKEVQ